VLHDVAASATVDSRRSARHAAPPTTHLVQGGGGVCRAAAGVDKGAGVGLRVHEPPQLAQSAHGGIPQQSADVLQPSPASVAAAALAAACAAC
jgi:hypothetical protein